MKYVEHFPLDICSIKLKSELGFKRYNRYNRTDIKTQTDSNNKPDNKNNDFMLLFKYWGDKMTKYQFV